MPSGGGRGANFGWNCFEGSLPFSGAGASCTPPLSNHTPPVLEYPHPMSGAAAVNGGYVIRDGALPSLLGRYVYADTYNVFGGELRTAQLFAGGASGDSGLGILATNVVSFGEDACAHVYVATIGGTVYRLEPTIGPVPCMPQTAPGSPSPPGTLGSAPFGSATAPAGTPPSCRGIPASIVGTPRDDVRTGTRGRDVMLGLGGNDTLLGVGGNDVICGAKGKDTLKGGRGNDRLLGQRGNDRLKGARGSDKLNGGRGADTCIGGRGRDSASGCEARKSI